jgi:hypothetical protein
MPEVAAEPMSPGDQGALALSAFLTTKVNPLRSGASNTRIMRSSGFELGPG